MCITDILLMFLLYFNNQILPLSFSSRTDLPSQSNHTPITDVINALMAPLPQVSSTVLRNTLANKIWFCRNN